MSDKIERAAEVIWGTKKAWRVDCETIAQALAAEGLLLTAEQERLIALGKAVHQRRYMHLISVRQGVVADETLSILSEYDALIADAERSRGATT